MILLSYGTRPEYIKIKPIIDIFEKEQYKILFTGQHKDIGDFGYDYSIEILDGCNRLDSIIQSSMNKLTYILKSEPRITHILVMGDTTSAFAMSLSAFNHKFESALRKLEQIRFPLNNNTIRIAELMYNKGDSQSA